MTEDGIRPTSNVEFSEEQTRAADDRDAAPRNRDLDEIIMISDEAIECVSTRPRRRWTS
jgi:hypothetical protein